jgi:hypothetical protein
VRPVQRLAIALALVLAVPVGAATRTIAFPLVVDHPILEAALRRDLGMADGRSLDLWGTVGDCHWAVVDEIALDAHGGRLRLVAKGSTVVGFRLLWFCISPIAWQGELSFATRPVVGRDWQLRFETLDVEARDPDGKKSPLTNAALQLVKGRLEERLREFHFDLGPPIDEAKALVRAAATSERARPALAALDTLRPLDTAVDDEGVRVRVALDVPDESETAGSPEAQLSDAELRAWQERIDRWDAFLVFAVKTLGSAKLDQRVRSELLAILLDGRRELVEVLRQGPVPGTDPVRALFLSSWDRLRTQTRRALRDGSTGDRAFRFVTFLAAGDALAALDQAGPGLGLEISADALRRLARTVDPERPGDPVAVSDAPDPELRTLFGFEDPGDEARLPVATTTVPTTSGVPVPDASSTTTETTPSIAPTEPSTTTPAAPVPTTPAPSLPEPTTTLPLSWLWSPRAAAAATIDLATLGKRLDRWVPTDDELATYRTLVDQLLTTLAGHRVDRVGRTLGPVYRNLVPSVAWQESCWRQFVERNGAVTYLLSATGDVGIMQVNRRVWRGFFDVRKLEWDVVYNAGAGAEILVQLLARFGTKEGTPHLDNAARATYSAYNGGPGAYQRYRAKKPGALARAIDTGFYEKYRQVAAGTAGDQVLCM